MPCVAQFGIIDEFEKDIDYSYDPGKYCCVAIPDVMLNDWWDELTIMKTYFHRFDRPGFALARWGITIIPPESLETFYEIISKDQRSKSSVELIELMVIVRKAISENRYMIHFGV